MNATPQPCIAFLRKGFAYAGLLLGLLSALVFTLLPASHAWAQSAAVGARVDFDGHAREWRRNAQHCLMVLDLADTVEADMEKLNQRRPRDKATQDQINVLTGNRTRLLNQFRDCCNQANKVELTPNAPRATAPSQGPRNAWTDPSRGVFVDDKGHAWKFAPSITKPDLANRTQHRFSLDISRPPSAAVSGGNSSFLSAEYIGPLGRNGQPMRIVEYGKRIPAPR